MDVLDGLVRLADHGSLLLRYLREVRLKQAEVVCRHGSEESVVKAGLADVRHGSLLSWRERAHLSAACATMPASDNSLSNKWRRINT